MIEIDCLVLGLVSATLFRHLWRSLLGHLRRVLLLFFAQIQNIDLLKLFPDVLVDLHLQDQLLQPVQLLRQVLILALQLHLLILLHLVILEQVLVYFIQRLGALLVPAALLVVCGQLVLQPVKHSFEVHFFGNQTVLFRLIHFWIVHLVVLVLKFEIFGEELIVSIIVNLADHQNLMDVGSSAEPLDFLALLLDYFDLDLEEKGGDYSLLELTGELFVAFHDPEPVLLSYGETFTSRVGFVYEVAFVVESATVVRDYNTFPLSQHEMLLSVYLETDITLALVKKQYLGEIIKLVKKDRVFRLGSRFQISQNLRHEVPILVVSPAIIIMWVLTKLLLKDEVFTIIGQEIRVKELFIKIILDLIRDLIKYIQVSNFAQSLILIMLPFELKVRLNLSLELHVKRFVIVETLAHPKKLGQIVSIVE